MEKNISNANSMFTAKSILKRSLIPGILGGAAVGGLMLHNRSQTKKYGKLGRGGPTKNQLERMLNDRGISYR